MHKFTGIAGKRYKLIECAAAPRLPTMSGPFTAYYYRSIVVGMHIAMVKDDIGDGQDVP